MSYPLAPGVHTSVCSRINGVACSHLEHVNHDRSRRGSWVRDASCSQAPLVFSRASLEPHCPALKVVAFGPIGTRKNQQAAIPSASTMGRKLARTPLRNLCPSWILRLVASVHEWRSHGRRCRRWHGCSSEVGHVFHGFLSREARCTTNTKRSLEPKWLDTPSSKSLPSKHQLD